MLSELASLKWGAVGVASSGAAALAFASARDPRSLASTLVASYLEHLRRRFQALFMRVDARGVLVMQALAIYGSVAVALSFRAPPVLVVAVIAVVLPGLVLERARRRRVARIEAQADTFVVALGNALRATPSIGDAFASLSGVIQEPLRSEIELAKKHIRLGTTLEEALLGMCRRIGSRAFDSALTAVVVGQRLGGNLPTVLATVGAAIRELHRLDRSAKAKTASVRTQLWIVAVVPFVLCYGMDRLSPGFFKPLAHGFTGTAALLAAVGLWASALLLARRILKVSI